MLFLRALDVARSRWYEAVIFCQREGSMKKVQEPTVRKTHIVSTGRIHGQLLIGLVGALVVMSVVVLSGQELKHVPPAAPSFVVLHSFAGPPDGAYPFADLIRDTSGNLYGTTGGGGSACGIGCGTVFKLSPTGTETVLHSFRDGSAGDGDFPYYGSRLVQDAGGNLYGTTPEGGAHGAGVIFKVSSSGTETVLYSFAGGAEGGGPADLVRDAAGNLYGTAGGGAYNGGAIFKVSSGGTETVLYSFTGGADGRGPNGLIRDAAGNLYGTTFEGGAVSSACFGGGCGLVFKLSPIGTETVLHTFTGGTDGGTPYAGVIQDAAGNLYGTTQIGGACAYTRGGCGVVFELIRCSSNPSGYDFKVLHTFTGEDGAFPLAALVRDAAGNLYGTTSQGGGTHNGGVVFKLSPAGIETVLYSFTNGADGYFPAAGVLQDAAGNLYGTSTYGGGSEGRGGVVFRLAP
jgi:uncharacterized repeat protein (TIGR03803 family)